MAKKLSFQQQYQLEQERKRAQEQAAALAQMRIRLAEAEAKEAAWKAAEAARVAALTPEQREAEEAERLARWNANRAVEIETQRRRSTPVERPDWVKLPDLEGEPE